MMKNFIVTALCLLLAGTAVACDACGCAAGGMGFGYIPFQKNHFVGLNYQYNRFETTHPALFSSEEEEHSVDRFNTATLWGRFYVKNRWVLSGFIPVKHNSVIGGNSDYRASGLGDIRLQALYAIVKNGTSTSVKQANWLLGSSIGLPTGKIDNATSKDLPNLQPGMGAFSGELNSIASFRRYNLGVNCELTVKTNGTRSDGYKFGNEVTSSTVVFYRLKAGRFSIIPQVGVSQFHRARDLQDVSSKTENEFSGIALVSAVSGVAIYTKKVGLRFLYELPMSHTISNGYTQPKNLTNLQFLYLIPSKK